MNNQIQVNLLNYYGFFLLASAVAAVVFIGPKAKTALMSGGISSLCSFGLAYGIQRDFAGYSVAGVILCLSLFGVFAWRSSKTFILLTEMISLKSDQIYSKSVAFLLISLMAVVSLFMSAILFSLVNL